MIFSVSGKPAFAYTAAHELDPKKRTAVFLHGAGLDHSLFGLQSRYFGYHGWNVLALDFPAHGRSAGPPIPTVAGMADWVLAILKSQNIDKAAWVGHSMGCLVALEAAARQPRAVERLALIGIAYPMKVGAEFLDAARRDHHDAFDMETIWGHAARVPLSGNPSPGMWMYGDSLARLRRLAPGVLYNDLKACNDYVLDGKISCPALLVVGGKDVMTPPRGALELQKHLENSKCVQIDFSGHSLMTEAPDATLDALVEFLR